MHIILERHTYAPELNVAHVGPSLVRVPAPGCRSISEVRSLLFKPVKPGRCLTLKAVNVSAYRDYDRTQAGRIDNLQQVSGLLAKFRAYHNLPGCQHVVKTSLIG